MLVSTKIHDAWCSGVYMDMCKACVVTYLSILALRQDNANLVSLGRVTGLHLNIKWFHFGALNCATLHKSM